jgi:hypothetical protein
MNVIKPILGYQCTSVPQPCVTVFNLNTTVSLLWHHLPCGLDKILIMRGFLWFVRCFNSVSGLYPLDTSSILLSCDNQKCLQTLTNAFWVVERKNHLLLRTVAL